MKKEKRRLCSGFAFVLVATDAVELYRVPDPSRVSTRAVASSVRQRAPSFCFAVFHALFFLLLFVPFMRGRGCKEKKVKAA